MKQEKIKNECGTTYQKYCNSMLEKKKAAQGDLNKSMEIAFELWAASFRITSDLSMQMEHIHEFMDVYGKIMPLKEQMLYKELVEKDSQAYQAASQVSARLEQDMTELMEQVFSELQDEDEESEYMNMKILWESGELMGKLKELIFVDGEAGRTGVKYILQQLE